MLDLMTDDAARNLLDFKRRRDADRARHLDNLFFRKNPGRIFRVRESLETEALPDLEGEMARNGCIVKVDRQNQQFIRWRLPMILSVFPDDDAFLSRLWVRLEEASALGIECNISRFEHRQWLIDTGHWKEPAHG